MDSLTHYCRDVNCPDEVALITSRHVALEYVGLAVDGSYFGAIIVKDHFLHRPVLPVFKSTTGLWWIRKQLAA